MIYFLDLVDLPLFTVWLEHEGNQENVFGGVYTYGAVRSKTYLSLVIC